MQKKDVIAAACRQLEQRLDALNEQLADIEQARNNETKSSAGDKYETSREMMQREADQIEARKLHTRDLLQRIHQFDPVTASITVQPGCLIHTNRGWYFLAVPLGKIKVGTETCFALSTDAPLGAQLLGKKTGDRFLFRDSEIEIQGIQ